MKKLDYLSTSQILILHNLKSIRNTIKTLNLLKPYLNSFREGENIYYLNDKGRAFVDCDKVRTKKTTVVHYIMRNYIYIAFEEPNSWQNEMRFRHEKINVVCDALFKIASQFHIVEVDYTQKMQNNRMKIEKYKKLINLNVFKTRPKFIWITTTEYRKKELTKLLEGLEHYIFLLQDFK